MSDACIAQIQPVLVDVGGRRLAARFVGQGEPLVLLEVGFGAESASWAAVAEGVARFTRVCFYDRAGRGGSDPAQRPRDAGALLRDAHRLLHSVAGSSPCVFVGQSFGGLIARLYAQSHPAEVAAVVLVDSLHEDQFDLLAPAGCDRRSDRSANRELAPATALATSLHLQSQAELPESLEPGAE